AGRRGARRIGQLALSQASFGVREQLLELRAGLDVRAGQVLDVELRIDQRSGFQGASPRAHGAFSPLSSGAPRSAPGGGASPRLPLSSKAMASPARGHRLALTTVIVTNT